ncbi:hypothetical protein V5O48_018234 [Marasmius crinis-equi]|uniref:Uncharacterized protein n=1 Tax=Marasmius crinis-equi TaxID=585013 RepID=A0ABR3ELR7_9AGAR
MLDYDPDYDSRSHAHNYTNTDSSDDHYSAANQHDTSPDHIYTPSYYNYASSYHNRTPVPPTCPPAVAATPPPRPSARI